MLEKLVPFLINAKKVSISVGYDEVENKETLKKQLKDFHKKFKKRITRELYDAINESDSQHYAQILINDSEIFSNMKIDHWK